MPRHRTTLRLAFASSLLMLAAACHAEPPVKPQSPKGEQQESKFAAANNPAVERTAKLLKKFEARLNNRGLGNTYRTASIGGSQKTFYTDLSWKPLWGGTAMPAALPPHILNYISNPEYGYYPLPGAEWIYGPLPPFDYAAFFLKKEIDLPAGARNISVQADIGSTHGYDTSVSFPAVIQIVDEVGLLPTNEDIDSHAVGILGVQNRMGHVEGNLSRLPREMWLVCYDYYQYRSEPFHDAAIAKITYRYDVDGQADLSATQAFSPNGDGTKDTNEITFSSTNDWILEVVGQGIIGRGAGSPTPQTLTWDGRVNGITLPDGKYTLRLKAGSEEKTAEVIIDTTSPLVSNIKNEPFTDSLGTKITAHLEDPIIGGGASGIEPSKIQVTINGQEITYGERSFDAETGTLTLTLSESDVVDHEIEDIPENTIEIKAEDKVGNKEDENLPLAYSNVRSLNTSLSHADQTRGYSLMAAPAAAIPTYYPLLGQEITLDLSAHSKQPVILTVRVWGPGKLLPYQTKSFNYLFSGGKTSWDWTPRLDQHRPVPAGRYEARLYKWGFAKTNTVSRFDISNNHVFDWFTGANQGGNRVKVIWGRPTSTHDLHYFNSIQVGVKTPQGADRANELRIWNALLPYFTNVVGTSGNINFGNIRQEIIKPARNSIDVFYQALQVDIHGVTRKLELHMNRRLDGTVVKETPTSAYVVP